VAEIDLDPSGFLKGINLAERTVLEAAVHRLWLNGKNLEGHAKNLAPKDKGELTDSIVSQKPKLEGSAWVVAVGANKPYAAKMHELLEPAIGAIYQRGPGTRAKSTATASRFGVAGGKYLERPLIGMKRTYTKRIADAIKGGLNGRRSRAMGRIRARGE
jgi:hypothetical protein